MAPSRNPLTFCWAAELARMQRAERQLVLYRCEIGPSDDGRGSVHLA